MLLGRAIIAAAITPSAALRRALDRGHDPHHTTAGRVVDYSRRGDRRAQH
jgi:hypothetical protein